MNLIHRGSVEWLPVFLILIKYSYINCKYLLNQDYSCSSFFSLKSQKIYFRSISVLLSEIVSLMEHNMMIYTAIFLQQTSPASHKSSPASTPNKQCSAESVHSAMGNLVPH